MDKAPIQCKCGRWIDLSECKESMINAEWICAECRHEEEVLFLQMQIDDRKAELRDLRAHIASYESEIEGLKLELEELQNDKTEGI